MLYDHAMKQNHIHCSAIHFPTCQASIVRFSHGFQDIDEHLVTADHVKYIIRLGLLLPDISNVLHDHNMVQETVH